MRICIYDEKMEPLTIADVPAPPRGAQAQEIQFRMREHAELPLLAPMTGDLSPEAMTVREWRFGILFEPKSRQGVPYWYGVVLERQSQQLLRDAFLPLMMTGVMAPSERAGFQIGFAEVLKGHRW